MTSGSLQVDREWTLFLDRDGVINRRILEGYVTRWEEFEFIPGVLKALKIVSGMFGKIFIVTNQQGIGKGIMTKSDVKDIHTKLMDKIEKEGGRIDAVYFSPFLEKEGSIHRKPNVGMALKARREFPGIRFNRSVMAGDSLSDMLFGRRLGMKTVFLSTNITELRHGYQLIDFAFPDLISFARYLNTTSPAP